MIEQGTDAWFQQRLGKVTASRVADVIAKTKSGYSASRKNYLSQLVVERLTGRQTESYTNAAMQHGIDTEPEARAAYSFFTGNDVVVAEFVQHPDIEQSGASPDGYVADDGLIEIKCPNTAQHIDTLINQSIDGKYITQMQWQMACTGRKWTDFVSYDNRMPAELSLFVKRVARDDKAIAELEDEVMGFLEELDDTILKLNLLRAA